MKLKIKSITIILILICTTLLLAQTGAVNIINGVVTMPAGAIGAPSLAWPCSGCGKLGFYKHSEFALGFPDNSIRFTDGSSASRFIDISSGNVDIGQTIHAGFDITFYNASGVGSGNTVALLSDTNLLFGPFTGGALNTGIVRDNADGILNIANAGLTLQSLRFKTQTAANNSTLGATTAYVDGAIGGIAAPLHSISFILDGGGSVIPTGDIKYYPTVDFACTINRIDISSDVSGSLTVDIWKAAGAIPTSGNKISASAPLTLSSAQLAQNGSLTGWSKTVSVGDVFGFNVATATTVTKAVGAIWCQ